MDYKQIISDYAELGRKIRSGFNAGVYNPNTRRKVYPFYVVNSEVMHAESRVQLVEGLSYVKAILDYNRTPLTCDFTFMIATISGAYTAQGTVSDLFNTNKFPTDLIVTTPAGARYTVPVPRNVSDELLFEKFSNLYKKHSDLDSSSLPLLYSGYRTLRNYVVSSDLLRDIKKSVEKS